MADLISPRPDGTVWLTLAGKKVTLRRPTVGEVRQIQDAANTASDLSLDVATETQEKIEALAEEHGVDLTLDASDPASKEQVKAAGPGWVKASRDLRNQMQRDQTDAWVAVGREMLALLAPGYDLPDDPDEMDPMFLGAALYNRLVQTWTTVPFD